MPALDPEDPTVIRWDFDDGRPMILARSAGEVCFVWVHKLATYSFPLHRPAAGIECVAAPLSGIERSAVIDGYYRVVLPMVLQSYGLESMHGTALTRDGQLQVFTLHARAKTGKTTLTLALAANGHRIVGDDALIVDAGGGAQPCLRPIPFVPRLRESTAELFALPVRQGLDDPGDIDEVGALPLAGCVIIEREGDGPATFTRLAPNDAFKRLFEHCYAFDPFRKERTSVMLKAYMQLARAVPVAVFRYPSGLGRLQGVAENLAGHLARMSS